MKSEIVIDSISKVSGDWNSGYSVDVAYHYDVDGHADGYTNDRIYIHRDIAQDDVAVRSYVEDQIGGEVEL